MVPGRGLSYQSLHAPPRPLAILIYGGSAMGASAALAKPDVRRTLEGVGHRVSVCENPAACKKAAGERHYDVVLADQSDAADLKQEAGGSKNGPVVVPVLMNASKSDFTKAKETYGLAYDAAGGGLRLLPVLVKAARAGH